AEFLDKYNKEAVIVTTSDAQGKSAEAYADDFYDENDFGTGSGKDGVLFLIDMDNRKIHVSTSGSMIDYLEDWRIEKSTMMYLHTWQTVHIIQPQLFL
ncbi:MAG: TPM domain-containing protein, partial [Spirochaetaceae bacterium]|nr:TPM domain-containing protein [Spirochaetaceae bacterium]